MLVAVQLLDIPNDAALRGVQVHSQIAMCSPIAYPNDPFRMSNGMTFELGVQAYAYGGRTGMRQWAVEPPLLGGRIAVQFSIDP